MHNLHFVSRANVILIQTKKLSRNNEVLITVWPSLASLTIIILDSITIFLIDSVFLTENEFHLHVHMYMTVYLVTVLCYSLICVTYTTKPFSFLCWSLTPNMYIVIHYIKIMASLNYMYKPISLKK